MSGDMEVNNWGSSRIKVQKFCYEWTISNFSLFMGGLRRKIQSPVFSLGANDELAWCLRVYTNGVDEESKDHVSVYLVLLSRPVRAIRAKFKFWIINSHGEKYQSRKHTIAISFLLNQEWGFRRFIPRDFLLSNQQWLLPGDQLTLCCKVNIVGADFSMPGQTMSPAIKDLKHILTYDLGELWENSLFTDCSLLVAGHEFRAHKAILAARSPVFRPEDQPTLCCNMNIVQGSFSISGQYRKLAIGVPSNKRPPP
ncbi:TD and POZ domain-containing protein 2-like [Mastomys coucha]|uniref:TD and POZ domain-containing protein 2-like n=1 Tax=Mastomys coucha TaxID=35658 RepID=UPI001261A9B1|nr:TD and POZ domain-containing protein 2-like [Mastomys coucha]